MRATLHYKIYCSFPFPRSGPASPTYTKHYPPSLLSLVAVVNLLDLAGKRISIVLLPEMKQQDHTDL